MKKKKILREDVQIDSKATLEAEAYENDYRRKETFKTHVSHILI